METKPNFPSQWNRGTPTAKPPRKPPSKLRGLVAFLILIALAGGAAWYLLMPADRGKVEIKPSGSVLIKDVGKDIKPKARTNDVATTTAKDAKPVRKGGPGGGLPSRFVDGHYVSPDPAYPEMKKWLDERNKNDPFKHLCDNMICNIVCAEPGDQLFPIPFDDHFEKEFLESLKDPIIPTHEDSEEVQAKKRAVNEAKIWLKQQMDEGKDIKKILTDARNKINGLADLTMFYRGEIIDLKRKEGITGAELQDYVDAANKVIDKYVAENFDFPHNAEKAHVKLPRGFLK